MSNLSPSRAGPPKTQGPAPDWLPMCVPVQQLRPGINWRENKKGRRPEKHKEGKVRVEEYICYDQQSIIRYYITVHELRGYSARR